LIPLSEQFVFTSGFAKYFFPHTGNRIFDQTFFGIGFPLTPNQGVTFGITLKFLQESFAKEYFAGFGYDLGLAMGLTSLEQGFGSSLAIALYDAQTVLRRTDAEIQRPQIFSLGCSLEYLAAQKIYLGIDSRTAPSAFFTSDRWWHFGAENALPTGTQQGLTLRIGAQGSTLPSGYTEITGGCSYFWQNYRLGYALQYPLAGSDGFHQLAFEMSLDPAATVAASPRANQGGGVPAKKQALEKETGQELASLFSALDSAAQMRETFITRPAETKSDISGTQASDQTASQDEGSTAGDAIGASREEQKVVAPSTGIEPEMPAFFSGNFAGAKASSQSNLRLEENNLKLHAVVNPFSPNGDGRQDNTIFVGRMQEPNSKAHSWLLTIHSGDRLLRAFKGGKRLPRNLEWDGRDYQGKILPDGSYQVGLQVFDENGFELESALQQVEIVTQPQKTIIAGPDSFALTGAQNGVTLDFTIKPPAVTTQWQWRVLDPNEKMLEQSSGARDIPALFTWRLAGKEKPPKPGLYKIEARFTDAVGLRVSAIHEIRLKYSGGDLEIQAKPENFEPGQQVSLGLRASESKAIKLWTIDVSSNANRKVVWTQTGQGAPRSLAWDGKFADGSLPKLGETFSVQGRAETMLGIKLSAEPVILSCQGEQGINQQALAVNLGLLKFSANSYELSEEHKKSLAQIHDTLNASQTAYELRIIGHADSKETPNPQKVSDLRAETVKNYLTQQLGLPGDAIRTQAKGADDPKVKSAKAKDRGKNQRVEIVLFAK
jgi:outer membrane protein OmpA-like peptidoglycan-associated protein